jgi:hypothetical protein
LDEAVVQHQVSHASSSLFRQGALPDSLVFESISHHLVFFVEGLDLLWTIEFCSETLPTLKIHLYPDVRGVWRAEEKVCDCIVYEYI